MITLDTIIFPDTDIHRDNKYPLMLFFSPLTYLLPVEPRPEGNDVDIFMDQGLCQGYTPAPLGEDRARFMRLIQDISQRKDDYAAQLSALTVAAMSQKSPKSTSESRSEIVSSLLGGADISTENDRKILELWQARFVLKIAEVLDREEEELMQSLQQLDSRELEMFRSLQGDAISDEDDPFSTIEKIATQRVSARPQEMRQRFNAWISLFTNKPLQNVPCWLASSPDAADQIFTRYEKRHGTIAIPILKIKIPAKMSESVDYVVEHIKQFHEKAENTHQSIINDLRSIANAQEYQTKSDDYLLPGTYDYGGLWNSLVDEYFPELSYGRSAITFYLLPECNIDKLLFQSDIPDNSQNSPHDILAVHMST